MAKVLVWSRRNLLNPEMPLFGLGIMAAVTICTLIGIIVRASFLKGLPSFDAQWSLVNYRNDNLSTKKERRSNKYGSHSYFSTRWQ